MQDYSLQISDVAPPTVAQPRASAQQSEPGFDPFALFPDLPPSPPESVSSITTQQVDAMPPTVTSARISPDLYNFAVEYNLPVVTVSQSGPGTTATVVGYSPVTGRSVASQLDCAGPLTAYWLGWYDQANSLPQC